MLQRAEYEYAKAELSLSNEVFLFLPGMKEAVRVTSLSHWKQLHEQFAPYAKSYIPKATPSLPYRKHPGHFERYPKHHEPPALLFPPPIPGTSRTPVKLPKRFV
jgi:hypothetical protein